MKTRFKLLLIALTLGVSGMVARAQGTAFTYQGRLNDGASPASGSYDLQFAIYDSTNNPGVLIAGPVTNSAASVSNGLFTAALDFGDGVFDGTPRFLEIAVRTNGGVSFVALAPRQALTPTPYAIFANSASNLVGALSPSQLSGTYGNAVNFNNGANSFSGTFLGQFFGSSFTGGNFTGNFLGTGSGLYDVWHTGGNAGTTSANFLGTTDTQPMVIKVNGQEAMRYETSLDTPNIIGGWSGNYVQPGLTAVTISGGGSPIPFNGKVQPNVVTNNGFNGVIAGGYNNMVTGYGANILGGSVNLSAGNFATIGGGQFHTNLGNYSVVGGGYQNLIKSGSVDAVIAGGFGNVIETNAGGTFIGGGGANTNEPNSYEAVIAGGYNNRIRHDSYASVIVGGYQNLIDTNNSEAFIGGGYSNFIGGYNFEATIVGGDLNSILSSYGASFIGGGYYNVIWTNGFQAVIGGGSFNTNDGNLSLIGGGDYNRIDAGPSVIGGGEFNTIGAGSSYATIPGGGYNSIQTTAYSSTIGGGYGNTMQGGAFNSVIGGGYTNTISSNAPASVIAGGTFNDIAQNAYLSVISGGTANSNSGPYTFIGGGVANTAAGFLSVSVGGQGNAAGANNSTMVGGLFNTNFGVLAFIGGGDFNLASGWASVIGGGESNRAFGFTSMAAGYHAGAFQDGDFVWSDFQPANFNSTSSNQFLIRAQNGVGINTNNPQAALHVNGTIIANNFSGSGSSLSGMSFSQLSGTLQNGQLSGTYSSPITLNNLGDSYAGNGAGLTSLNANSLASGTVPDARLSGNVAFLNHSQTFIGTNSFLTGTGTASRLMVIGSTGIDTNRFTGLGFQYYTGTGEGAIMSSFDDGFASLAFYTKQGNGFPIAKRMVIDNNGNVGIGNFAPTNLFMVGFARCDGSTWINASDRNLKENFAAINGEEILDKVARMPITEWNYKTEAHTTHLGPVAQDFHAAFQLGSDDRSIATVDESGVALAAIQGLHQKLAKQQVELKEKETEIAELKQRLEKLEQLMAQLHDERK